MDSKLSEDYIDACILAKKTLSFLPEPPRELQRRHFHILRIFHAVEAEKGEVKVSDIARKIGMTLPSIAKNVAELENLGYLKKVANPDDKRIVNLEMTPKGRQLYQKNVVFYHQHNAEILQGISDEEIKSTIATIRQVYQLMNAEYGTGNKEDNKDV